MSASQTSKSAASKVLETLETLLSSPYPPECIHLHHPHHPSTAVLAELSRTNASSRSNPEFNSITSQAPEYTLACVDAIECHTPRLLFSAIISRLRDALGLDEGHGTASGSGEISTVDGLLWHLQVAWAGRSSPITSDSQRKMLEVKGTGARRAVENQHHSGALVHDVEHDLGAITRNRNQALVIVITKAERLSRIIGPSWSVVTRLAELTGLPLAVVLASAVPYDEIRPPRGDALEPIHLYLPAPSKDDIIQALLPKTPHPLYSRFLDLIISSLYSITCLPQEVEYISTLLWPIYTALLPPHAEQTLLGRSHDDATNPPPPLLVTVKLLTELKHQLSLPLAAAIEAVLTRQTGHQQFQQAMTPPTSTTFDFALAPKRTIPRPPALDLPLCAKYLMVAAYCASYNPPKSDLRLFGRGTGPDGKRKKGGGTRRAGYGRVRMGKIAQRLLGPKPFPLDRFLAIFASLYAEHAERPDDLAPTMNDSDASGSDTSDVDEYATIAQRQSKIEKRRRREAERNERWDDEVDHLTMSVRLWSLIPELESQGLLKRVSPPDRLDNIMLRCEADYEVAKDLARELKIVLDDYIYEGAQ